MGEGLWRDCRKNVSNVDDGRLTIESVCPSSVVYGLFSMVWFKHCDVLPSVFLVQVAATFPPCIKSAA